MENKVIFGMVGGGWRAGFFLRVARELPERFEICGMVVREETRRKVLEKQWGVKTYRTIDSLLKAAVPSFIVVAVPWDAAPGIIRELADRGVAVLSETPPAPDLDGLIALNKLSRSGAKIQVAEQYHLQPLHAARLAVAGSEKLGEVTQVQLSVCHWYHAMSLIRKFLGVGFANAAITAYSFEFPLVDGVDRDGVITEERIINSRQVIAILDFNGKLGLYDFAYEQYFSWVRSFGILVRGKRGEIKDTTVKYLQDFRTPIELDFKRITAGENGNLEGYYLKGIMAGGEWVYQNPFIPGRLTDDEIAVASCLLSMDRYVQGGPGFYSLAEAAQDHYLALMIERSVKTRERIITERQPWAED